MNIKLEKINEGWKADLLDLPGTPPCGEGLTKEMAIACLFYRIITSFRFRNNTDWISFINTNKPLLINNEIYKNPWSKL